ncbi:MAG: AAA family ATPase [Planctomycetota bacterium]|nr:AAA family ATPase [Planctomycetota bacterium]
MPRGHCFGSQWQAMYQSHWKMSCRPFDHGYDGRFFYPSQTHHGTMLKLRYAIENRRELAVLAGDSGTGKTLLVHHLLRSLSSENQPRCHIVFPRLPVAELLVYVTDQLAGRVSEETVDLRTSVNRFENVVRSAVESGQHPVVVLDEAHLMSDPLALETFRLLLNFRHHDCCMFTLVLVGNRLLLSTLEGSLELQGRVDSCSLLQPLSIDETIGYIQFRLAAVGVDQPIFDYAALEAIHYGASGNPRVINRICDLALLMGYAQERHEIGVEEVHAVVEEAIVPIVP